MNKKIKDILKFLLFLIFGVVIFLWVYNEQDTKKIILSLKKANYWWIALSLFLGFVSHLSRAIRWNILIRPLGYKPRLINSLSSILIMYLSNTAIPRSGEFVRCGIMKKYEKIPFSKLLGTVVVERIFDFIMLFILLAVVLITQMPIVVKLIEKNPYITDKLDKIFTGQVQIIIALIMIIVIIVLYLLRKKIIKTNLFNKIHGFIKNFVEGIKTVYHMKNKVAFIFHSILIWVLYFFMIYVTFFSFEFTADLSILTGLTVFVMASFGMVFPAPGGIGSWHFMVIQTLLVYGIADVSEAGAFAFAAHGSMTIFLIIVGIISFILIPIVNRQYQY